MTSHDLRCPRCGAHAVAGADWCTLCYADLRPPAEPEPVAELEPSAFEVAVPGHPVAATVAAENGARSHGKHARRASAEQQTAVGERAEGDLAVAVDVDLMMARLAAETTAPLGSFMDRFESKGSRVLVMCGGVAAVGLALLLVMTMLGSLL